MSKVIDCLPARRVKPLKEGQAIATLATADQHARPPVCTGFLEDQFGTTRHAR
jgi:hypothetical protein